MMFAGKERLTRLRDEMHQSCSPAFGNVLVDEAIIEQACPLRYGIRTGLDRGHSWRQAAHTIGQLLHTLSCSREGTDQASTMDAIHAMTFPVRKVKALTTQKTALFCIFVQPDAFHQNPQQPYQPAFRPVLLLSLWNDAGREAVCWWDGVSVGVWFAGM
jgi:hypothetical protein